MRLFVRCPAKINTFLAVGRRDATGYHPVRTILQAVSLYDTIVVSTETAKTRIVFRGMEVPSENTVEKALRLASELAVIPPLDIQVRKVIPMGAGLGGGSSDAAGLLRALQRILPKPLSAETLFDTATAVGVDTPFFLVGGRARAEGYGEKLAPLPDAPRRWLLIAKPEGVSVSTHDAYCDLDALSYPWQEFSADESGIYNDFQRVAPPESLALIQELEGTEATHVGLAGSGSAVLGFFPNGRAAREARESLGTGWAIRTISKVESLSIREC